MKNYLIALALLCLFASCKKDSSKTLPATMQIVTNGYGHGGYDISLYITNQSGIKIFNSDTLSFNIYPITYNVNVKPGDVLKAVYNSGITNIQVQAPTVDIQFNYNGKTLVDLNGGIYNTTAFYDNNASANNITFTIPN
jgi:hypothetical protein